MKNLLRITTILAGSTLAYIAGQESIKFYGQHSVQVPQKTQEKTKTIPLDDFELSLEHREGPFVKKPKLKTLQIPQKYSGNYPNFKYTGKNENFDEDSDTLLLARAFYGEARGEINTNPEYVYMVAESIQSRMKDGSTVRKVLLKKTPNSAKDSMITYHYTCFAPNDPMFSKIKDPKEIQTFEKCYALARFFLSKDYKNPYPELKGITNYFVSIGDPEKHRTKKEADHYNIPGWAYQKENKDGKFQLNGPKRIPIEPLTVISLENNQNAYGYDLGL